MTPPENVVLGTLPQPGGLKSYLAALATLSRDGRRAVASKPMVFSVESLSQASIDRYTRELGFKHGDHPPLTYTYLIAQRAQLGLMLSKAFPFPVLGMVHVENDMQSLRPMAPDRPVQLKAHATEEPPTSSGARYISMHVELHQEGHLAVWCRSRYLARRGRSTSDKAKRPRENDPGGEIIGSYPLSLDAGRKYARVSGDTNPIHLWPWSARLFGFKRPIIHGMHTVGRVAALLEQHLGQPLDRIRAQFLRPIMLPASVEVRLAQNKFEVYSAGVRSVVGEVSSR